MGIAKIEKIEKIAKIAKNGLNGEFQHKKKKIYTF